MAKQTAKKATAQKPGPVKSELDQKYDSLEAKIRGNRQPMPAGMFNPADFDTHAVEAPARKPTKIDHDALLRLPVNPYADLEDRLRQIIRSCLTLESVARSIYRENASALVQQMFLLIDHQKTLPGWTEIASKKFLQLPIRPVSYVHGRFGGRPVAGSYCELAIDVAESFEATFWFVSNPKDIAQWREWAQQFGRNADSGIPDDLLANVQRELRQLASGTQVVDSHPSPTDTPAIQCLVNRQQIADAVHLENSGMSRRTAEWGDPEVPASGRRRAKWDYLKICDVLARQFPEYHWPDTFAPSTNLEKLRP